ncbi:HNH endonuclease [Paenibacillus albicereus]|uniref:HNH endonuclease n=1 Tax=Paenibacillus albicereus TaxID=2726185 RepID=UPI00197CF5B6|nr:HNH endonuclease [Paenibacillus albicereus]
MTTTKRTYWLMGEEFPLRKCNDCGCDLPSIPSVRWNKKDFDLCYLCLQKAHDLLFGEPNNSQPSPKKKQPISQTLRIAMLKRDGHACRYCGSEDELTADHVIPESAGGPTTLDNLVTACRTCNTKKGRKSLEESGLILRQV